MTGATPFPLTQRCMAAFTPSNERNTVEWRSTIPGSFFFVHCQNKPSSTTPFWSKRLSNNWKLSAVDNCPGEDFALKQKSIIRKNQKSKIQQIQNQYETLPMLIWILLVQNPWFFYQSSFSRVQKPHSSWNIYPSQQLRDRVHIPENSPGPVRRDGEMPQIAAGGGVGLLCATVFLALKIKPLDSRSKWDANLGKLRRLLIQKRREFFSSYFAILFAITLINI